MSLTSSRGLRQAQAADQQAQAAGQADAGIGPRIDSVYADLSRSEQRVADYIWDHLDDLAVYSATELASRSGVSKATVSRLFRRLGFTSAAEVRDQARALRHQGVPIGRQPAAAGLAEHLAQEQANLIKMAASLDKKRLRTVVRLIAKAPSVLIIGQRNSYPPALHLRQQLAQARDRVTLAPTPGQSIGEDLACLGARDVIIVIGFRRRPASFGRQLTALAERPSKIILIGDSSSRRMGEHVTHWLECPVDSLSPLDSYAAPMSMKIGRAHV